MAPHTSSTQALSTEWAEVTPLEDVMHTDSWRSHPSTKPPSLLVTPGTQQLAHSGVCKVKCTVSSLSLAALDHLEWFPEKQQTQGLAAFLHLPRSFSQHFSSPSQHSSASCHGRLCSLCVIYPLFSPAEPTVLHFTCTCPSTQANHMTALNWGLLISLLFLNHKGQGNFTFLSSEAPNSSSQLVYHIPSVQLFNKITA